MRYKLRPFFKDVSFTFVTQLLVLITFFYGYNLIAGYFGPKGVGEYSLVKRIIVFFQPILLLGLGMGLTRYIAVSKDSRQRGNYIRVGGTMIGLIVLMAFLVMNILDRYFAKTFLGDYSYVELVRPISFFVVGITAHALVSSCLRGLQLARAYNLLDIVSLALLPITILLFVKDLTMSKLISLIGIYTFVIALLFVSFFVKEITSDKGNWEYVKPLKELALYSFPRFLNGFVYAVFFSIGPICAAHFMPIRDVGYLAVCQSLLGTIGSLIAPLGIVLLPKIASLISQKRDVEIQENVTHLVSATVYCSLFVLIQMVVFADVLIGFWLGPEFAGSVVAMRIILISIPFYMFCGTAGNVLEAARVKPINLINLSISLLISVSVLVLFLYVFEILPPLIVFSGSLTVGLISFGVLSYISIRAIYPDKTRSDIKSIFPAFFINVLLGWGALSVKSFVSENLYYLIVFECFLLVLFGMAVWRIKAVWLRILPEKVFAT